MQGKHYAWMMFVWMVMIMLDGIGSGTSAGRESNVNVALSLDVLKMYSIIGISIPLPNLSFFTACYGLASCDFLYLDNTFGKLLRLFVGLPLMALLIWGLMTTVLPIIVTGVTGILSFISNSLSGLASFFRIGG